jgi:heptosyltransferase-2
MTDLPKQSQMLVRGTNWIGDSVMSVAALRELRRLLPDQHIALLVKEWVAGLFEEQDFVDEVLVFGQGESTLSRVRPYRFSRFGTAILFQNAFEAALLAFLSRIPERLGYDTEWRGMMLTRSASPRIKDLGRHQVYYYLDLLYQTGISQIDYLNSPGFQPNITLTPTASGLEKAHALLAHHSLQEETPLVGVNPGAFFGPAKRWLTNRYAELADRLIEECGAKILILGSAGEKQFAAEIESFMVHKPVTLTGATDLDSLIGLLSQCDLLVTNDSGPMHLAASLDIPQVAIFGSTDEIATGPFSSKARVIHKHVECSPCLRRECPIDLRCFTRIEVDEVFETVKELIP